MSIKENADEAKKTWRQIVQSYQNPDVRTSIWQLVNTLVPYFI